MVDEGYNSHSIIRSTLSMGASLPTNTIITDWVNMIDAIIEGYRAAPPTGTAAQIEMNRIGVIYGRVMDGKNEYTDKPVIAPLTKDEETALDDGETMWWD